VRSNRPRVLLVRPDHLGDVLMATPAVELLRKALPDAHLTMMVGPWSEAVARRDPLLDDVVVCPFPGFTRAARGSPLAPYRLLWRIASDVKAGHYDAALVLRFDHWWGAWMAALAGIPVRVGCRVRECAPFLTEAIDPPGRVHWVAQSMAVASRLLEKWDSASTPGIGAPVGSQSPGRASSKPRFHQGSVSRRPRNADVGQGYVLGVPPLRFSLTWDDERLAGELWAEVDLNPRVPVVAFHPGTGSPVKLWSREHWVALGRALAAQGAQVLVTGSPEEAGLAERIAREIPGGRSLAGRTDVGALAGLFRRCRLVVGVDNGPLHLAVAVGTPTVHLFGPSDPAIYGPWGDAGRHRVVSAGWPGAPCSRLDLPVPEGISPPCMNAITPEQVAAECAPAMNDQ